MNQTHAVLNQDVIAQLIARPRGEDPVVSLYVSTNASDWRAALKSLVKEGEAQIEADTGWDEARKKTARRLLALARETAEERLQGGARQRRSYAIFVDPAGVEVVELPLTVRERVVVDRSPYASPLSSLIDQYERYGVVFCDSKKARLFDVYLQQLSDWEELEDEHQPHRHAPAGGPARRGGGPAGGYHGLEELRRRNHAEYLLHQHLRRVADRAFRRFKLRPYDRLILLGPKEVLAKLEEHLHDYLRRRVVAREPAPSDLTPETALELVCGIEERVEKEKEEALLREIEERRGKSGLGAAGLDESLRALFFGQVDVLVVADDEPIPGRECPECHFLFERPEDREDTSATLVECPLCKRPTRRVPDIVDEAVELAILSGARVEHIAYCKPRLRDLGGMAAVLRFK
ncbi:MAG: hypothetical protein D6731_21880 [Planctomycetota bacterium]|nr:MAG: hypothetical protein D6731_21880 [Planctomycetota bacterium]